MSELGGISLNDFNHLCKEYFKIREKLDDLKKEVSGTEFQRRQFEDRIISIMHASGQSKHSIEGLGTISCSTRKTFKVPKTQEQKEVLFAFLQAQGVYSNLITVNSNSLNSFMKEFLEQFETNGLDMPNPQDLGLEPPYVQEILRMKKG